MVRRLPSPVAVVHVMHSLVRVAQRQERLGAPGISSARCALLWICLLVLLSNACDARAACDHHGQEQQLKRLLSPNRYAVLLVRGSDGERRRLVVNSDEARRVFAMLAIDGFAGTANGGFYAGVLQPQELLALKGSEIAARRKLKNFIVRIEYDLACSLSGSLLLQTNQTAVAARDRAIDEILQKQFRDISVEPNRRKRFALRPEYKSAFTCEHLAMLLEAGFNVGRSANNVTIIVTTC
jgi:hypothetical protein